MFYLEIINNCNSSLVLKVVIFCYIHVQILEQIDLPITVGFTSHKYTTKSCNLNLKGFLFLLDLTFKNVVDVTSCY